LPVEEGKNMNSVALIGRLIADPEIRYFESGKSITKFILAVSRNREEADFFELEAWEKTAEIVSQYCRKGSKIGVSGSLHQERWQDNASGANRSKVVVRCSRVDLLDTRNDEQNSVNVPTTTVAASASGLPSVSRADYDNIPF
jgi:single-strand DNA-binding protein